MWDSNGCLFYLAAEEYAARYIDVAPLFLYWQVEPTVIFGRNQNMESEVNVEYCRKHNIQMFRRKSGGGCVYADLDNLMLCYIEKGDDVQLTYSCFITLMTGVLRRLGLDVKPTGRNDITIDGKKISGSAFYHIPNGRNIVHSTMLYDTDIANMVASITPPNEKLVAKRCGKRKEQNRAFERLYVFCLFRKSSMNCEECFCGDKVIRLGEDALLEIRKIEQTYTDPDFLYGKGKHWSVVRKGRVEGCGELEVRLSVRNGKISAMEMAGDFFATADIELFLQIIAGNELRKGNSAKTFRGFPARQSDTRS